MGNRNPKRRPPRSGRPVGKTHRVTAFGNQGGAVATCTCGWKFEDDDEHSVIIAMREHKKWP